MTGTVTSGRPRRRLVVAGSWSSRAPEPAIIRLGRILETLGLRPDARLEALSDESWNAAFAELREHIERERAA